MFCENVGFEENHVTYAKYKEYMHRYKINNLVETEGMIEKQREIKDEEEGPSFETIVASGENTSKPHAVPTERKIQEIDIITIDMGCKINGYCSDMTRTFFVGEVPSHVKEVYELVLKNQEQVLKDMRENSNTKQITKMVDNDFRLHNYDLIHALGHGVGLEIHESPVLSCNSESILKENMVVTDEPGIYIAGQFGIRIEDTVLITKGGCEPLTKSPKKYVIIK